MNKKEIRVITDPEVITNTYCSTNNSTKKLLNFARLHHNVSGILEDNIFEPTILLETIISDLEILSQEVKSLQKNQAILRKEIRQIIREELIAALSGGIHG